MGAAQEKTKGVKAAKGDAWKPLALMRVSSSVVERRLAEAIARPLLSFAASGGLEKFGDWQPLKQAKGAAAWGQCPRAVPPRPEEKWDGTRRSYDVTESNAFERAMAADAYKTEMCKAFARGQCSFGNACTFAHSAHERAPCRLRQPAPLPVRGRVRVRAWRGVLCATRRGVPC